MKRFLTVLLAMLLMMTALTACGGDKNGDKDKGSDKGTSTTAAGNNEDGNNTSNEGGNNQTDLYTLVKNATDHVLSASSYEANIDLSIVADIMGNKMSTTADLVTKKGGGRVRLSGKAAMDAFGTKEEADYDYYFDGSYMYTVMYDQGFKMPMTLEEFEEDAGSATEHIAVLPQSLFEGLSGDGSNVVITMDEATAEQLYGDDIIAMCSDIVGEDLNQVTTKDAKVTLSIKNGVLVSYKTEYVCEMGSGTETAVYTFSQTSEFSSIGGAVAVTPIEGCEDFPLMDEY